MEPITEDLSGRKQNIFFIEMERENRVSTELRLKGWQTITILRHEHLQAQHLVATFVKGLCRGMISIYLDV